MTKPIKYRIPRGNKYTSVWKRLCYGTGDYANQLNYDRKTYTRDTSLKSDSMHTRVRDIIDFESVIIPMNFTMWTLHDLRKTFSIMTALDGSKSNPNKPNPQR